MADRACSTDMFDPVMLTLPIRERDATGGAACQQSTGTVVSHGTVTVGTLRRRTGVGTQMAAPAIRRCAGGDRVRAGRSSQRMAAGTEAPGAVCSTEMGGSGIGEGVPACRLDRTVDMLRRVGKTGPSCIDVGMAADTVRRSLAGMGRSSGRIAVTFGTINSRIPGQER